MHDVSLARSPSSLAHPALASARPALAVFALGVMCALTVPSAARAQLSALDQFLTDACTGGAVGAELAARCAEADRGGTFELSGDSEGSLNPTQTLRQNEANLQRARAQERTVQQRLEARRAESRGGRATSGLDGLGFLLGGNVATIDYEARRGERGFDGTNGGIQALVDYRLNDRALVGFLFDWNRTEHDFDEDQDGTNFVAPSDDGSMESDVYSFTLFGSVRPIEAVFVDLSVGGGFGEYEFQRNAVFQESTRTVAQTNVRTEGTPDGWHANVGATAGYELAHGPILLAPYARFHFVHNEIDDYTERDLAGSGLALDVESVERESLTTALGLRGSYAIGTPIGTLSPNFRIEYEHEFRRDRERVATAFAQDATGQSLTVSGASPDRDYFHLGVGFAWLLPYGIQAFSEYATILDHDEYSRHQWNFGVRAEL